MHCQRDNENSNKRRKKRGERRKRERETDAKSVIYPRARVDTSCISAAEKRKRERERESCIDYLLACLARMFATAVRSVSRFPPVLPFFSLSRSRSRARGAALSSRRGSFLRARSHGRCCTYGAFREELRGW